MSVNRTVVLPDWDDHKKFAKAEEVKKIAAKLIPEYHSHLAEARILCLFKKGTWNSQGKTVLAKAYIVPEQWAYLTGHNLLIVVNHEVWHRLTEKQRSALIDHELSRFNREDSPSSGASLGDPVWSMVGHDIEEFSGVVQRHGLWAKDIEKFFTAAKQMTINELMILKGGRDD